MKAVMISDYDFMNAVRMSLLEMAAKDREAKKEPTPSQEELALIRTIMSENRPVSLPLDFGR